jgi:O-antigen/teichoic acid export membrane protein
MTALMANILSYSDIGFWSQVLFSSSLFTSIVGFNIPNGIIAIVPRINKKEEKYELILKSILFLVLVGLFFCFNLIFFRDFISKILFNEILDLKIFVLILTIGFGELLLEFILYTYRSIKNFSFSNYVLILRILPRVVAIAGILKNDINLILYLYSSTYFFACIFTYLTLFKNNRNNILSLLTKKLKNLFSLNPKPYLRSLFTLSRKSVLATITASSFFFLIRSITLSNKGLDGVGEFSLAISAGAIILSITTFTGFTFYPYVSNLAIVEKEKAFLKTKELSLKIIYFSLFISFILIIIKYISRSNLNFYPFTINSLDLFLSFLGYGFLGAYQVAQPFAFALTDSINVFKIELLSSLISLVLICIITLSDKFSIHLALLSFCIYTFCNYFQANYRNFKILKEKNV